MQSTHQEPVDILLDTDMSVDVDDVGALCLAHALADLGEINIIAIVHDANLNTGVGARYLPSINHYSATITGATTSRWEPTAGRSARATAIQTGREAAEAHTQT